MTTKTTKPVRTVAPAGVPGGPKARPARQKKAKAAPTPTDPKALRPPQPIDVVQWVPRESLHANDYNPNHVFPIEMRLLELSILKSGWTAGILVQKATMAIVDGFHRWTISDWPKMRERFHGMVPVVFVDLSPAELRAATVRHNRARGVHGVVPMGKIINEMIHEHGLTPEAVCEELGMEMEEINRLLDTRSMPDKAAHTDDFGRAWRPKH